MPTETFDATGSTQTWTVPDGVETIFATVRGAGGADGDTDGSTPGGDGGNGAEIQAYIPVTPGETLTFYVGEGASGATGGWPTGADGGGDIPGGGSGGGSEIRGPGGTLSDRLLVAGGGGGGGGTSGVVFAGDGGDATSTNGQDGGDVSGDGGTGATQTDPGTGGSGQVNGDGGSGPDGGAGGGEPSYPGGGAGGGGYFGAGGGGSPITPGGAGGGGGAGSSWLDSSATLESSTDAAVSGDGQITIEYPGPPETVLVTEERDTEVDLSWSEVSNADQYHVYRHDATDPYTNGTQVATVASGTTSYTDAGLTNGTTYHYQVTSEDADLGESGPSAEVTATTTVPATQIDSTDANTDSVTLAWVKQDDTTTGSFEIYRSETEGSLGSLVDTVDVSASEYTDTGLAEVTEYWYTLRRVTGDGAEADSDQSGVTTGLSPPANVSIDTDTYDTRLLVSWDDPGDQNIEHRVTVLDGGRTIDESDVLEAGTTDHVTDHVVPNRDNASELDVVVASVVDGTESDTTETASVLMIDVEEAQYTVAFRTGTGELFQLDRNWTETPNWRSEPNAVTSWQATVPESPALEELAFPTTDVFVWFGDELLLRGEFTRPETTDSAAETTIAGDDILKTLERGGSIDTYQSVEVANAIRDYVATHLDGWEITVHDPEPEMIDEGLVVQEASTTADLETLFGAAVSDGDPAEIAGDAFALKQSSQLLDGWDDRQNGVGSVVEEAEYSGSGSGSFGASLSLSGSGTVETWEFETQYTYAETDVAIPLRVHTPGDTPHVEFRLDGNHLADVGPTSSAFGTDVGWRDMADSSIGPVDEGWTYGALDPGTHTLEIEILDDSSGDIRIDAVCLQDNRYDYTFDGDPTDVDGVNLLDGPGDYPDAYTATAEEFDQAFNVDAARLTVGMDAVSNNQRLQVSNNGGQTWNPDPELAANRAQIDVNFDTFGTTIAGRVRLSRHAPDGARDTSPRYGYAGQSLSSWELAIDTNTIPVLDEFEVTDSDLQNLQRLCNEGGFVIVPDYDAEQYRADIFVAGQLERTADWTRLDHSRSADTTDYANALTVVGATDETTGERLVATAESETEIDRVGRVEAPPMFKSEIESEEQLRNIARVNLGELIAEDSLQGSLDIVPKPIRPGFSYPVEALDGESKTLWAVEYRDTRGPQGSLEFEPPDDLAAAITAITVDVRETRGSI